MLLLETMMIEIGDMQVFVSFGDHMLNVSL